MTSRYTAQAAVTDHADRSCFDGVLRPSGQPGRHDAYQSAPTVQSHAAVLERLPDGDLGLAWFGGTQEGVSDVSIWLSRLAPGTEAWSRPMRVSDDPERSEQNPVLFSTPGGDVWLLYTAQVGGSQDTAEVRRRVSHDSGRTWGAAETFAAATPEGGGVFIRQPVLITSGGRWLLPIFRCPRLGMSRWSGEADTSAAMLSDDGGATWRTVEVPSSTGCVHMSVVELGDGTLHALFRSRRADRIHESRSVDDGETWSAPVPTMLPNNNSSIQHRRLGDGRLAVVYNHSSRQDATARRASLYDEIDDAGGLDVLPSRDGDRLLIEASEQGVFWGAPRAPLSLAFSDDDGATWRVAGDLDEGDGYCLTNDSRSGANREFSYPAILPAADGGFDIAYTYFRQTIKHVHISADWRGPGA